MIAFAFLFEKLFILLLLLRQSLIHNGGVIPKQLYKTESIEEPDGYVDDFEADASEEVTATTKIKLNEANLYQNIKLRPGQCFEIVIKNDDHRAVLTWDFESVKTEVLFTIFDTDVDMNVSNGELTFMTWSDNIFNDS